MSAAGLGAWLRDRRAHLAVAALAVALALSPALGCEPPWAAPAGDGLRDGDRIDARAELRTPPRPGAFGASAEVVVVSGRARGARLLARLPRRAGRLAAARPGLLVRLTGAFAELRSDPADEFDHAAHLRRRGVAGELAVERARLTGGRRGGLAGALDGVRTRAEAGIAAGLAPAAAALARGMVLGADERIPHALRDDFRDSGLAHLLAVSGQNVMLLVALATPLLAAAGLSHGARVAALLGLIALYVPLAGGGPSIQRAGVMGAAGLLAVALGRPASRWLALGLAACATLALQPRAVGEPGWQLSFAAVAGILAVGPALRSRLGALPHLAAEGIAVTVAATLATAPLLALHFGSVPVAGLGANLAALALVAPIMWLGMVRAALGQAPDGPLAAPAEAANALAGLALAPLLDALERLAALFADAPGGQLALSLEGPLALACAYAALAVALAAIRAGARRLQTAGRVGAARLRRLPRRRRVALACAAAGLASLALARGLAPAGAPATLTVTFLDVGQGDATLVQHPDGATVLFDGGPPEGGVARLLRRAGVRRLSLLALTHASRDHHGGLAEVVERFPVDAVLDGGDGTRDRGFRAVVDRAVEGGARRIEGVAPLELRVGALTVAVLGPSARPPGPPPEDPNPRALVAVVSSGGYDLLVSGDAESGSLLSLALPDVDALKVPHHGSSDPGLGELLDAIEPELAAIPVGANSYGHPAPSTLAALRAAGVATWRTDRHGSVRVVVEGGAATVEAERGEPVAAGP